MTYTLLGMPSKGMVMTEGLQAMSFHVHLPVFSIPFFYVLFLSFKLKDTFPFNIHSLNLTVTYMFNILIFSTLSKHLLINNYSFLSSVSFFNYYS